MDMSSKQRSAKNDRQVSDILFLGAIAITLTTVICFGIPIDNKSSPAIVGIILSANIMMWGMTIYFKIHADHKELKQLIEGKYQ